MDLRPSLKADIDKYIPAILIIFVLFGLACKLLLAIHNDLNSDTVVPGLQSMEMFRHGNIFLDGFHFPVNYPYVFTDLVPFYAVTQLLTNYSPTALSLTGFFIYVLTLIVYSLIIFTISGNKLQALIFAALFSNLTPSSYIFFMQAVSHGATLLFCGIIFLWALYLEKMHYVWQIIFAVIIFLIAFSDTMSLAIIVIPLACIFFYKALVNKRSAAEAAIRPALVVLAPALLAYCLKLVMPSMEHMEIATVTTYNSLVDIPMALAQNISLYANDLLMALNGNLFALANGSMGFFDIISLVLDHFIRLCHPEY